MKPDQFPLPGYTISPEERQGRGATYIYWGRVFNADNRLEARYQWHVIDVYSLRPDIDANSWIRTQQCTTQIPGSSASEVPAPRVVGEGAKACRRMDADGVPALSYYTGTRNIGLWLQTAPAAVQASAGPQQLATDAEALDLLALLAERQIAIIDQVAPPGTVMASTTGTPKFRFTAPETLPAAEGGKPYLPNGQPFSFCNPPTIGFTTPCGPTPPTTNPIGGSPPYHFQYSTMGGFPPFGMALGKDGQLTGTPHKATGGKSYRFTVCAVDLKANFVCREVSLTVNAPKPNLTVEFDRFFNNSTDMEAYDLGSTGTYTVFLRCIASNRGPGDASAFSFRFYDGNTLLKTFTISGLKAGAGDSETARVQMPSGTHTFRCVVDEENSIQETNESDNAETITQTLRASRETFAGSFSGGFGSFTSRNGCRFDYPFTVDMQFPLTYNADGSAAGSGTVSVTIPTRATYTPPNQDCIGNTLSRSASGTVTVTRDGAVSASMTGARSTTFSFTGRKSGDTISGSASVGTESTLTSTSGDTTVRPTASASNVTLQKR